MAARIRVAQVVASSAPQPIIRIAEVDASNAAQARLRVARVSADYASSRPRIRVAKMLVTPIPNPQPRVRVARVDATVVATTSQLMIREGGAFVPRDVYLRVSGAWDLM